MAAPRGLISAIRRYATHDGPGIRTTVCFKGCPLRCAWCSSPETQAAHVELLFDARRCQDCGRCLPLCPASALRRERSDRVDRQRCTRCLDCVAACPYAAYAAVGRELSTDELLRAVLQDRPFYGSDGGVTLSGGEPLAQPGPALALLAACRARGLTTVLDTSGHAPVEVVAEAAKLADLVLLDIKHIDPAAHLDGTGVDNARVLASAEILARRTTVRLSLPLVPGFNDDAGNLRATARFARSLGVRWIDLLPLHALGLQGYRLLGRATPAVLGRAPSADSVAEARRQLEALGVETTMGRMF